MAKTITSKGGKDEVIDLTKKVTVIMTEDAPHHKAGEENSVHPKIAEHFIERGYATLKKGESLKDEKGGDE